MSEEITDAEVQLCVAAKNIRKPSFTRDDLRAFGSLAFKEKLEDWSAEFERWHESGLLKEDAGTYSLTDRGAAWAEKVALSEFFGRMLVRAERSRSFGIFCERLYGKNLVQFGTADMEQMEKMLSVMSLSERDHLLDAGCGIGATAEYISGLTGAKVTGVDAAEPAIERAAERTKDNDRLSFVVGNLDALAFPAASFDAIIAIDTLYFSKDLAATVARKKSILKPGGQMALFMSEIIGPDDPPEQLAANETKLARALKANGLSFEAHDFTEANREFWERSVRIAEEMLPEFEAEGNKDLCEGRIIEGGAVLGLATSGRMSRYLYHARL